MILTAFIFLWYCSAVLPARRENSIYRHDGLSVCHVGHPHTMEVFIGRISVSVLASSLYEFHMNFL